MLQATPFVVLYFGISVALYDLIKFVFCALNIYKYFYLRLLITLSYVRLQMDMQIPKITIRKKYSFHKLLSLASITISIPVGNVHFSFVDIIER